MTSNVFSTPMDAGREPVIKEFLNKRGFEFTTVNHAFWKAQHAGISIIFYKSGKLVIQGKGAVDFAHEFLEIPDQNQGLEHITNINAWIGADEAGKGDFFGPLVVAAVHITKKDVRELVMLQVQDSKRMTDKKITQIAEKIRQKFDYALKIIEPGEYNRIYPQYNNLNKLLARAHGEVISRLLKKHTSDAVLIDKFADESLIENELRSKTRTKLVQIERAEINPAVAAAAILARSSFVEVLTRISQKYNIVLPKGASEQVVSSGKEFVRAHGKSKLENVAKLHFKTVNKL
ncbi:ribonuclease HIII [candidate division KSB1 bacterium]|nr:ribonuclease HIII [candidate division KSB1 bacterium]